MNNNKINNIKYFNLDNINGAKPPIIFPDIYFTPEYGRCCEYSDNAIWELCKYKDLIYVYLKREHIINNTKYYDLITPYGYSGYYFLKQDTFDEFLILFRKEAYNKNYIKEIVRQNPYLDNNITNYDILKTKTIYGIEINDYNYYWKNILHSKKRNMIKKAIKLNLSYELKPINLLLINNIFKDLYQENMIKVNALKYYYFNDNYFNSLGKLKNTYISIVRENNKPIGSAIFFVFNKYIHYHLSCNNNSTNCITDFLLTNVIKELCVNKILILGGGLEDGDSLSNFKKKISNKEYKYTIYENIINHKINNII